jgi:hypothetical protein
MKMVSLKLLIRRFVLATSFPPFLQIYRLFYGIVIHMTLRVFKRYPFIKSVYLRRGGAKGEILPLISDIDFAVIGEKTNEEDKKELFRDYNTLAKITTLLDQTLEVYDEETLYKHYETNDYFQYRFMEGKETWKLLYGKDYLKELPALPVEKMYGGFYTEIKVWWSLFAWRLFQARKYGEEALTRNNICYKAVSEILKMNLALNQSTLTFDRRETIERSKALFSGKDREFLEKLENMEEKRFRIDDVGIVDETKDFIILFLDRFYGEFQDHPYSRPLKNITQMVDCPKEELLLGEEENTHIKRLVGYVKERWTHSYRGAYLVSSSYFNLDELLLMIEIDPKRVPTVHEITALNLFHLNAHAGLRSRIRLFLLLQNAAFETHPDDLKKSWQSILSPPCNPDLFELLGRPEFTLDGGDYKPSVASVWTPLVKHFFREERTLFYELLENPSIYKLNSLDFLRVFWKTVQLVLMNRSVERGEIFYPLTLQAVKRALVNWGIPLPDQLKNLSDAYRNELEGKRMEIARLIPPAIQYLKGINL